VISQLIQETQLWGFELVMAGNLKGYLDRYSNPETIIPEADKRGLDYYACASYADGTKLSIEMALVANGYGMRAAVPGMYGPRTGEVLDVFDAFALDEMWKDRRPAVDYMLGAKPVGGVFAVGYCEHPYQQFMLSWFPAQQGEGPFYVFHRPYHLIHIEAMHTVAMAALEGEALLAPDCGFKTNVYAYAKKDLKAGEILDGIGGFSCYGKIENCEENRTKPGLPVCLIEKVAAKRDIKKDEKIFFEDVKIPGGSDNFELFDEAVARSESMSNK
jgi:predicted homoserine dehydrogenase-like protein